MRKQYNMVIGYWKGHTALLKTVSSYATAWNGQFKNNQLCCFLVITFLIIVQCVLKKKKKLQLLHSSPIARYSTCPKALRYSPVMKGDCFHNVWSIVSKPFLHLQTPAGKSLLQSCAMVKDPHSLQAQTDTVITHKNQLSGSRMIDCCLTLNVSA